MGLLDFLKRKKKPRAALEVNVFKRKPVVLGLVAQPDPDAGRLPEMPTEPVTPTPAPMYFGGVEYDEIEVGETYFFIPDDYVEDPFKSVEEKRIDATVLAIKEGYVKYHIGTGSLNPTSRLLKEFKKHFSHRLVEK